MTLKSIKNNKYYQQLYKTISNRLLPFWKKYQLPIVISGIIVLIALLILSPFLKSEPEIPETPELVRKVETFPLQNINLTQTAPATIKNLSSITLVAQSAGPISYIKAVEGTKVYRGNLIASQSSSYSGGNSAAISKQIADKSLELSTQNLENTVQIVSKNRELADKNRDNTEQLRRISDESIGQTEDIIDLTNDLIDTYEAAIIANPSDTASLTALQSYKSALLQLETNLKNTRYQTDTDNPPTQLANINKDLVYLSTELQLKSAQINQDIAQLNVKAAQIALSMTQVTAPFSGTIEKIYVQPGEYVTPGTPIAKISGETNLCLITTVSGSLALRINQDANLQINIDGQTYEFPINHVTSSPVSGQTFEVLSTLPASLAQQLYEGQTLEVQLPLFATNSLNTESVFIPLDAVFVTNTSRFVYLIQDNIATKRIVETGQIVGNNIEIKSVLLSTDTIILDRTVNENEKVEAI